MYIPSMPPRDNRPAGDRCEVTFRDTFAASALGGLLAASDPNSWADDLWADDICRTAFGWADSMLQVRNGAPSGCETVQSKTNLDAAPAARADLPDERPPNAVSANGGTPCAASRDGSGTGRQPAPPSVETDGFSSGSSSELINRKAERQSPDRECGESSLRDVSRPDTKGKAAGGPEPKSPTDVEELLSELRSLAESGEGSTYVIRQTACDAECAIERLRAWVIELQLSKVEIDALQHVVEDGRFVDLADYGRLRLLLVRLRPEWEGESDDVSDAKTTTNEPRNGAPSGVPDPDSQVWETTCTPPPHDAPPQGSVQVKGGVPCSQTENEPVAWWLRGSEYDTGCEYEYVSLLRENAESAAKEGGTVVPLYTSPTLTDAEREAVKSAIWDYEQNDGDADCASMAATLRGLLERMKGDTHAV